MKRERERGGGGRKEREGEREQFEYRIFRSMYFYLCDIIFKRVDFFYNFFYSVKLL